MALHGWGSNAGDLAALTPLLNLPTYQFLFPNAPLMHPHVSTGRMWYDFQSQQGLSESQKRLLEWLSALEEKTGVPLSRTVVAGFSQGAAMALDVGLGLPLAGLVALSGYLHPIQVSPNKHYPPVLLVHGNQDAVVPIELALEARDSLRQRGVKVQYHEFEMGHEVPPSVIPLIKKFIQTAINKEL